MVSPPHEAMHRIFQHDPKLFSRLSQVLGVALPTPVEVTVLPTDLTETSPVERRVDTLLQLSSAEHGTFLLAVEAQGKKVPDKPASWAYYTAYLWTKYKLPTALLVVCQDRATAEWAGRAVTSGPPELPTLTIAPVVDPIVEFISQGVGGNRRAVELWRNLMAVDLSFYKSWLAEEIRDEGRAEALVKKGAEDVLLVLETRGIDVPDEIRERITGCDNPDLLRHWLTRAVTATDAAELFDGE